MTKISEDDSLRISQRLAPSGVIDEQDAIRIARSSKISKDDVLRLARLSKIKLSDTQASKLANDMNQIDNYVQLLNEVDTDNVKPTPQVSGLENITRKDEVIDYGISQAELLKNASDSKDGLIKVPKVL